MEIWRDIPGYEGLYQVSNLGNVKSLNWKSTGREKNLYLKPHNKGYYQVELAKNGRKKTFVVHRLVALAFIENPNGFSCINHKDEDKHNNCVENLEWCTASYNVKYSLARKQRTTHVSRRKGCRYKGTNSDKHILQIAPDGTIVKEWECPREIFCKTGMSDWSISECCRGKRKTAYGYKWQYAD